MMRIKMFVLCVMFCGCVDEQPSPYPSCRSLGCDDPTKYTRECAQTGECYCDADPTDPEPAVRCEPDAAAIGGG